MIADSKPDQIYCPMPIMRLVPVDEGDDDEENNNATATAGGKKLFECPMFQNYERSGDDNYVMNLELPTFEPPETWILRGVALLSQKPKAD